MDMPGVALTLLIGPVIAVPAPAFLMEALESLEVTHADNQPSVFQLTFHADRTSALVPDYQLMLSHILSAGMRVAAVVTLAGKVPRTICDGFITHLQLAHDKARGGAVISVTGEDVGVQMDMTERAFEYPMLGDFEIVAAVLAKYALYGVIPMVMPTLSSMASNPLERTPVQYGTDRSYIQQLAALHGNVFMVRPGPAPLTNVAYWGPPPRVGLPNPTLSVDMGWATNVESIDFAYDGRAPTRFYGVVQDADTELDVPIATLTGLRLPLALEPAMLANGLFVRESLFNKTGMTAIDAEAYAQGMTDRSTDNAVTASGEVDTLRYGAVIDAPGLVFVRGCGTSFDGLYYVSTVTHSLRRGAYRQRFGLAREGLMPLSPVAPP